MKKFYKFRSGLIVILNILSISIFAQHFEQIWDSNPYQPMSILITSVQFSNQALSSGDEVAVFDVDSQGNEICVGFSIVSEPISPSTPLVITASSDDPTTESIDGFTLGDKIIYRVYLASEQEEITELTGAYDLQYDTVYNPFGTSLVELKLKSPENIIATVVDNVVTISWESPEKNVSSYNIYRNEVLIGNTTENTYMDSGLSLGTYIYCVTAVYSVGESDHKCSDPLEVTTVISPPTNVSATVDLYDVILTWDAPQGKSLTGYNIYRNDTLITNTEETTFTDYNLPEGTYTYCVSAVFDGGESEKVCADPVTIIIDGIEDVNASYVKLFPNPAKDNVCFEYNLVSESQVKIAIYDLTGKVIDIVLDRNETKGIHKVRYNLNKLNNGVYLYIIDVTEQNDKYWIYSGNMVKE